MNLESFKENGVLPFDVEPDIDSVEDLIKLLEKHNPTAAQWIPMDEVESIGFYMVLFRSLVKMVGLEDEIKRIIAVPSKNDIGGVELSFYFNEEKQRWLFEYDPPFIDSDFLSQSFSFLSNSSDQKFYSGSVKDESFWLVLCLPKSLKTNLLDLA